MNKLLFLVCALAAAHFLAAAQPVGASDEPMLIGKISLSGNRKIESDTILSYIGTKEGDPFSAKQIRRDLQAIFDSGFFRDVQVDAQPFEGKLHLTFILREKPSVKEILIEGNDELSEEKIRKSIDIKVNSILDETALKKTAGEIKKIYAESGYYLAQVTPEVKELNEFSAAITFKIEEGAEVTIDEIRFTGNEAFSQEELSDIIQTSEYWFFSWLTGSGHLREEELQADLERLLAFYFDRGYILAKVGDPKIELNPDKTRLTITIPVSEGLQFTISKISFKGNRIVDTQTLESILESKAGEVFNRSKVRKDIDSISSLYADQGYLLTQVYPDTDEKTDTKTVELTYNISEGEVTSVDRINITGNTKTRDKVIRREMRLVEGELFSASDLKRSKARINNLGFFEKVDMQTRESPQKNVLDINLKVKERLTGSITMGAGWSSVNKIVGNVSVAQGNLFGRGQRLALSASFGRVIQTYNLSFTEPWLFDIPLTAGFDLYSKTRRQLTFSRYQVDRQGGAISLGYPLAEYLRGSSTYRYEEVDVHNVPDDAPLLLQRREGKSSTSSILFSLVRDSRDNFLRPTKGSRNSISYEFAGSVLGGDNFYHRTTADSSWHFPLFWKFVFSAHGHIGYETGYGGRDIPIQELFTAGGATTVRSFKYGALGPREEGEVIGGNKILVFNAELHFPLFDPLTGLFFYDIGNAFGEGTNYQLNDLRTGAGFGIRFFTPMGPIRLDWGYKLDRRENESVYEWHFAMGTYF